MPASTSLIADTKSVISNGSNAASKAKAIAAAGPIMDYPGNLNAMLLNFQGADVLLKQIKTDTDAADTNLTNINAVLATLEGTGGPSGTVITAMKAVYAQAPTAATKALAIAPAGPIMDYPGNVKQVLRRFEEVAALIVYILDDTDSTDATNLTLLQNIQTALT